MSESGWRKKSQILFKSGRSKSLELVVSITETGKQEKEPFSGQLWTCIKIYVTYEGEGQYCMVVKS